MPGATDHSLVPRPTYRGEILGSDNYPTLPAEPPIHCTRLLVLSSPHLLLPHLSAGDTNLPFQNRMAEKLYWLCRLRNFASRLYRSEAI